MERLHAVIGPLNTNVYVLADPSTPRGDRDRHGHAVPAWIAERARRTAGWTLKLIVSTHGHWDHVGDNAAVAEHTGAQIAIHPADNHYLLDPEAAVRAVPDHPLGARPWSWPRAARSASARSACASCTRPATPTGSVCLLDEDEGLLFSGDTLFPGGWGRVDLPGGSPELMAESIARLAGLDDALRVLPGPRRRHDDRARSARGWTSSDARAGCRSSGPGSGQASLSPVLSLHGRSPSE